MSPDVFEGATGVLVEEGRKQDAVTLLELAVEQFPKSRTLHQSLGEALEGVGDKAKAAGKYREALRLLPADSSIGKEEKAGLRRALEEHLRRMGH